MARGCRRRPKEASADEVTVALSALFTAALATAAFAEDEFKEYPIGEGQSLHNIEVAVVYPRDDRRGAARHGPARLAGGISTWKSTFMPRWATPTASARASGLPYLTVFYKLQSVNTGRVLTGNLMPMVAVDGPQLRLEHHKMPGADNYKLTYTIEISGEVGLQPSHRQVQVRARSRS